ncbi:unnamed protein product [Pieris macdunnoughi]|uniref:PiggyBac transposable element-derived protein domain-containing protein n=1 Tax=Pieris macdunnoughi TaxID=345717 RepID=A0A821UFG2_9NEOP|nr:unnamed protein product [Pieris macdunnoughi]
MRKRKTHLVGTLRTIGGGIVALKWRDKRDVLMLSTKQSGLKTVAKRNRRGESISKPASIEDYNLGKSSIDESDQMATYGSALRRCTKWYRKLMFEIIWGISLVNAHFLYNQYTCKKKQTQSFVNESSER